MVLAGDVQFLRVTILPSFISLLHFSLFVIMMCDHNHYTTKEDTVCINRFANEALQ